MFAYGAPQTGVTKRPSKLTRPHDAAGIPGTGRIVKMLTGQGHGFIRLPSAREVYFHRADLKEGTVFNDLRVGDAVKFDLLEDTVSGARAVRVTRQKKSR